jgi:SAM-dependent methyltransferase
MEVPVSDHDNDINLTWWEERAPLHPETPLYKAMYDQLRSGGVALKQIERDEVGEVDGLSLLHLQCHVGTDTLSWARLGAKVTGVDFSPAALTEAARFAEELGLAADFVHSRVEDAGALLAPSSFDIVFTSYGAYHWFEDLKGWAKTIATALKPGGFFYIVDAHPVLFTIDYQDFAADSAPRLKYDYFEGEGPLRTDEPVGSYADPDLATQHNSTDEWPHSLSELLTAVLDAGLQLEFFHEHRTAPWKPFECCIEKEDGLYSMPSRMERLVPMLFSLRARKPSS